MCIRDSYGPTYWVNWADSIGSKAKVLGLIAAARSPSLVPRTGVLLLLGLVEPSHRNVAVVLPSVQL